MITQYRSPIFFSITILMFTLSLLMPNQVRAEITKHHLGTANHKIAKHGHHHKRLPIGLSVHVLPHGYHRVHIGAHVYYRLGVNTYRWRPKQKDYVVVVEPEIGGSDSANDESNDNSIAPLVFYPANNQTEQQQIDDRFACHRWAKQQTGFDPLASNGSKASQYSHYQRAISACMEAKDYVVN